MLDIPQETLDQRRTVAEQSNLMYVPALEAAQLEGVPLSGGFWPWGFRSGKMLNMGEGRIWFKEAGNGAIYTVQLQIGELDEKGERLVIPKQADSIMIFPAIARCNMYSAPDRYKKYLRPIKEASLDEIRGYVPSLNRVLENYGFPEVPLL